VVCVGNTISAYIMEERYIPMWLAVGGQLFDMSQRRKNIENSKEYPITMARRLEASR
jgi:hypothetical protein